MDARIVVSVLVRYWVILVFFSSVGLLGGILYSLSERESYTASMLFYLKPRVGSGSEEKDYFAQLRTRDFTETLVPFLSSEDFQNEVQVGIRARKVAPQLVRISTTANSEGDSVANIQKARFFAENKVTEIASEADPFLNLSLLSKNPSIAKFSPKPILNITVGLLFGFTLGAMVISLKVYFWPPQK